MRRKNFDLIDFNRPWYWCCCLIPDDWERPDGQVPRPAPSLLLSSYLCRIKQKENSSCSACGHLLQNLTHLLDCLTSKPFRHAIFGPQHFWPLIQTFGCDPTVGSPWSSYSQAMPQGLDQRSKMAERNSDTGKSRNMWVRSCSWWLQGRCCNKISPFVLSCLDKKTKEGCKWQQNLDSSQWVRPRRASSSEETKGIEQKRKLWEIFCLQLA